MEFFDSHCHLGAPQFQDDHAEVIERARVTGVTRFAVICDSVSEARDVLSRMDPDLITVGIHSHYAQTTTEDDIADLAILIASDRFSALGEIGLDTVRSQAPLDVQITLFERLVRIARESNLPMILHCRSAFPQMFTVLEREKYFSGVFHCFTGTTNDVQRAVSHGFMISYSAVLGYPSSNALRETVSHVPDELLLIETDSPYLPPQQLRGARNEPAHVIEVAKTLADIKKVSLETIASLTTENAKRFYRCT